MVTLPYDLVGELCLWAAHVRLREARYDVHVRLVVLLCLGITTADDVN